MTIEGDAMAGFLDSAAVGAAVRQALKQGPRAVAVPYIGPGAPNEVLSLLKSGDTLICDASDGTLAGGATAPAKLRQLLAAGVDVRSNQDLHAKVYVGRRAAVVGSYNLSLRAQGNLEAGALLEDRADVAAARAFVLGLREHRATVTVDEAFLDRAAVIYRPPVPSSGPTSGAGKTLHVVTYGDRVSAAIARFAEDHQPAPTGSGEFVDWSLGDSRAFAVGDVVLWVERDGRKRQEHWNTRWPAVCDLKVPVGDADRNWIYYWRYADADTKPWGEVVKSVAFHARGYELRPDSYVRRADVVDAVFRLFPGPLLPPSPQATLADFLTEMGVVDLPALAERLADDTHLDVEVRDEGGITVAYLARDGAQMETIGYSVTAEEFWAKAAEVEHETLRLQAYCDLGREIEDVEGFPISLVGPEGGTADFTPWPYDRAARGSWTLREWVAKRFAAVYGDEAVPVVLRDGGGAVRANTRLSTLRRMAADGELQGPEFFAESWL
jgi:hypothetical protein